MGKAKNFINAIKGAVQETLKGDLDDDLYYKYVHQTTPLISYENMRDRELGRYKLHSKKAHEIKQLTSPYLRWRHGLAKNANLRMEMWINLINEKSQ